MKKYKNDWMNGERQKTVDICKKVISFLNHLCESIYSGKITLENLDMGAIRSFLSVGVAGGITGQPEHAIVKNDIQLLEYAIEEGNALLAVMALENMASQCKLVMDTVQSLSSEFQEIDQEWISRIQRIYENNEYVSKQYSNHVLGNRKQSFSGRVVVYTAVTGGYDDILDPQYVSSDMDYICFTDNPDLHSDVWQIRMVENPEGLDNIRLARKYKCLAADILSEYDYSIWLDGKFCLAGDIRELINIYAIDSGLLAFPHYERDCVYEEANACLKVGKGNADEILHQVKKMQNKGYPEKNGLVDTGCLIRNHRDALLSKVMREWWHEIQTESTRDQLSFNYICHKNDYKYDLINMDLYNNSYLINQKHQR